MLGPTVLTIGALYAVLPYQVAAAASPQASTRAAPARPAHIAVQEELDQARKAGTLEAYDLFLARHPDDALASIARAERRRLKR